METFLLVFLVTVVVLLMFFIYLFLIAMFEEVFGINKFVSAIILLLMMIAMCLI